MIVMAPHRYRSPYHSLEPGVGVFEHIGGNLALIKPGLELTENDRMREKGVMHKNLQVYQYALLNHREANHAY
jgi:hypothetical protein